MSKKNDLKLMKKQRDYLYHFYTQICIFKNVHNMIKEENKYPTLLTNLMCYIKFFNKVSKEILNVGEGPDLDTLNEVGTKWQEELPKVQEMLEKTVNAKKENKNDSNSMYG